jgi:hypothetical protein
MPVIALAVVLAAPGLALSTGPGFGFYGFGGHVSFVKPDEIDGTFGAGVHADMGEFATNTVLYPSLTFWSKSYEERAFGVTVDASFTEFALNGDIRFYFLGAETGTVRPFIGGGPALALTMSKGEVTSDIDLPEGFILSDYEWDDSEFDIGVNIFAGTDFVFDEGLGGFLEARFKIDGVEVFKITGGVTFGTGG